MSSKIITIFIIRVLPTMKIYELLYEADYKIGKNQCYTAKKQSNTSMSFACFVILHKLFGRYGNIFTKISCLSCRSATDHWPERTHLPATHQQDPGYVWAGQAPACDGLSGL